MRLVLLATSLLLVVPPHAGHAGPKKKGKIVRIERTRGGSRGTPRFCQFNQGDNSGTCYGLPAEQGEIGSLLTPEGVMATAKVAKIEPQNNGSSCANTGLWRAEFEVQGLQDPTRLNWNAWIVFDVALGAGAKLADAPAEMPGGVPGESAAITVDRDGVAPADFLVTWFQCPNPNGQSMQTYCVDYWFNSSSPDMRWTKTREDTVSWCM
jgi:hypothetical protein